jgi:hypothetical protein
LFEFEVCWLNWPEKGSAEGFLEQLSGATQPRTAGSFYGRLQRKDEM